jgi:hypothetical protein
MAVRDDDAEHVKWVEAFATPMLVLWAILLPGIFAFLVFLIRHKLNDSENRYRLGFFYNEYEQHAYFWEFVKIFEKEFIIIALTYYEEDIVVKGLLIFFMIFIYGELSYKVNPFKSKMLNDLDFFSTTVCEVSICLAILMY